MSDLQIWQRKLQKFTSFYERCSTVILSYVEPGLYIDDDQVHSLNIFVILSEYLKVVREKPYPRSPILRFSLSWPDRKRGLDNRRDQPTTAANPFKTADNPVFNNCTNFIP
jgi:hypothetical protein